MERAHTSLTGSNAAYLESLASMDDPLVILDKLKTYCGQAGFSHMFHNTIGFYNVSRYHADGTSYMSPARDVFDFIENKHERGVVVVSLSRYGANSSKP